jgi:hypothetical protein
MQTHSVNTKQETQNNIIITQTTFRRYRNNLHALASVQNLSQS